ncbi:MAG: DUF4174 domain-containing protein [Rubrobacter sp.]|nr:DUF4174 domain-containing protein [Rubrobacter sp.]
MDFDAQRGGHRLFLLFSPAPNDPDYQRQNRALTGSEEGFSERDLLRGDLLETGTGSFGGEPAPSRQVLAARKRFHSPRSSSARTARSSIARTHQ